MIHWLDKRKTLKQRQLLSGCQSAVYKEFQRQKIATIKFARQTKIIEKLLKFAKKEKAYEKGIDDILKYITKSPVFIANWEKAVKPQNLAKILLFWMNRAGEDGGQKALDNMGVKVAFNLRNPDIIDELSERGDEITGNVSKRTLNDFRRILVNNYEKEGMDVYTIEKKIRGLFEDTYEGRSWTIARTETGTAQSKVEYETYERNGIQKKRWRAVMDDATRPTHRAANGQVRDMEEPFDVGEAELMYPLDPDGPPEEVINCRCTAEYIMDLSKPYKPVFVGQ